jgi:protein-disulfide isomerase
VLAIVPDRIRVIVRQHLEQILMNKTFPIALAALIAVSGCSEKAAEQTPSSTKWLATAVKTNDGGMLRGNPNAKVKLVVYSALSCADCARFAARSNLALDGYVANGKVSYEFRNYNSDVTDLPATLIARCAGPKQFFPITAKLFQNQTSWRGSSDVPDAVDADAIAAMPSELLAVVLATKLGLDKFAETQGMTAERAKACLSDKNAIAEFNRTTDTAKKSLGVTALPAFFVNGQRVNGAKTWEALEPVLKSSGA